MRKITGLGIRTSAHVGITAGLGQSAGTTTAPSLVIRDNRVRIPEFGLAFDVDASHHVVTGNRVVARPSHRRRSLGIFAQIISQEGSPTAFGEVRDKRVRNVRMGLVVTQRGSSSGRVEVTGNRVSGCNGNAMIADAGSVGEMLVRIPSEYRVR